MAINAITRAGGEFDEIIQERWNHKLMWDMTVGNTLDKFEGGVMKNFEIAGPKSKSQNFKGDFLQSRAVVDQASGDVWMNGGEFTGMPVVIGGDNYADVTSGGNPNHSGDIIHMTVYKPFVPVFQEDDSLLESKETKMDFGQYDMGVNAYRAATAFTKSASELTFKNNPQLAYAGLAYAAARHKDALGFSELLYGGGTNTGGSSFTQGDVTSFAGTSTNSAGVVSSTSGISVDDLNKGFFKLKSQGAMPIMIDRKSPGKNLTSKNVPKFVALISANDEYNLSLDSDYENILTSTRARDDSNELISGHILDLHGKYVYVVEDPDQGGVRIGNPLRPVTTFSAATGTGTGTLTVGSTTDTYVNYTVFFPPSGQLLVQDASGATIEVLTYTSKTNYQFVISARAVVGTATNHASGTTVSLVTNRVLYLGGQALLRSYGKQPEFIFQINDYKEKVGLGVRFVCGHQALLDSTGTPKNFAILETHGFNDL